MAGGRGEAGNPDETVVALVTGHGLKEPEGDDIETASVGDDSEALRTMLLG